MEKAVSMHNLPLHSCPAFPGSCEAVPAANAHAHLRTAFTSEAATETALSSQASGEGCRDVEGVAGCHLSQAGGALLICTFSTFVAL